MFMSNRSTSIMLASLTLLSRAALLVAAPEDTTADAVVGQTDFTSKEINAGGGVNSATATSLQEPRGMVVSPTDGRLWVADTLNSRVLSWPTPAGFTNGQAPDIVLGQADFTSNQANKGGANPSETTLNKPRSVTVDKAGRLYVADSSNFRILRYDPPITSNQAAVQVFGQPNFTTAVQNNGGTSNTSLGNPDGITIDMNDNVYLIDRNLHRVLIFNTPAATDNVADIVLGQAAFNTNTANQPGGTPTAGNLNMPIAGHVDAAGNLYVCDEGNSRVLLYNPPFANGQAAVKVFGQLDFVSGNANQGGANASAGSLSGPVGATVDPVTGRLLVADPINNRILEYNDPLTGDAVADRVFGQPDFTTRTVNTGGVSADSINDVAGVSTDAAGNLFASDRLNHRVLRYDAPPPMMNDMNNMDGDGNGGTSMSCGTCGPGVAGLLPLALVGWIAHRVRGPRRVRPLPDSADRAAERLA